MIISRKHTKLIAIATSSVAVLAIAIYGWLHLPTTNAADMSKFDPGNIMSDAVMSNKSSMSVQQIQAFLESKNPCNNTNVHMAAWYPHLNYTIRDGKFVCMAKDTFNGKSAAQIIWQASQDYSINPQFLIVLLEKEQGLITDTWPNHIQYRSATGFGCPDTAACDSKYFGLENQIRNAANLFRTVLNGGWSNYPVGWTYVQYNPNASCGGKVINIQNRATSALYRYTPYQPNQSAISAGYGIGDSCGAYGNRNTWALFTDWFGETTSGIYIDINSAESDINQLAKRNASILGQPTSSAIPEYDSSPRVWRSFTNGQVIWSPKIGAKYILYESTYGRWSATGGSLGSLGIPITNTSTESNDGRSWQDFKHGTVIYSDTTGGWEVVPGPIGDKWRTLGGSTGILGKPTSSVVVEKSGHRLQRFEKGTITRLGLNAESIEVYGGIFNRWSKIESKLGHPTSAAVTESDGRTWQNFEKGVIIHSETTGAWEMPNDLFNSEWRRLGGSIGKLGKPTSAAVTESDGRTWQNFEKGVIIQPASSYRAYAIYNNAIFQRWKNLGGSLGSLGTPTGDSITESDGRTWQNFEKGVIIHSEATGAWEVFFGKIHTQWQLLGGSRGLLGKPIAPPFTQLGKQTQKFEKGEVSI